MNQFDTLKERAVEKSVVWNAKEDPVYKEFMKTDYRREDKLKLNKVDNHTHSLIYEYKVKPDPFKTLLSKKFCNIPLWIFVLLFIIGLICLIGAIAVICIKVFALPNFSVFGERCNEHKKCNPFKNLVCQNSVCECSSNLLFWDGSQCDYIKNYGESCTQDSQCGSNGLICQTTSGACNCPKTSIVAMCDCPSTQYFDLTNNTCRSRVGLGVACLFDNQCQTSNNLVCSTSSSVCVCAANSFLNNGQCELKKDHGVGCSASLPCDDTKYLFCSSTTNVCECQTDYFYNNSLCVPANTFGQYCASPSQCSSTKQLVCISNVCSCQTGATWFWSTTYDQCINCPAPMVIEQNHCYLITTSSLVNYNNAQTACQTLQADLCKVSTDAEYQALLIYTSGIAAYNNFWIGARSVSSGNFRWIDSSALPLIDSRWCSGEPSSPTGCVRLQKYVASSFRNELCYSERNCNPNLLNYCCEKTS